MANTKHLIKHICYPATINGRNFRTKLALYVICILNISCETFLFKSSYLSLSLSPSPTLLLAATIALRWNTYRIIPKVKRRKNELEWENMKQFTTHVKNGVALS